MKIFLIAILSGFFYASGFDILFAHSFWFGPAVYFFLLNFLLLKPQVSHKQTLLICWGASLGFYLYGFYWIPQTLREFGNVYFPFNHLLGLLFSFVIAPQIYLYALILLQIKKFRPSPSPFLLAIIYTLLERYTPQQFPAHIGHSLIGLTPYLKLSLAPFIGAFGYSYFMAVLGLTFLDLKKSRRTLSMYSFILIFILLHIIPSSFPVPQSQTYSKLKIKIVQPNISNFLKLDSERGGSFSTNQVLSDYRELSHKGHASDLIIWPETSYPTFLNYQGIQNKNELHLERTIVIKEIAQNENASLFFGGYDYDFNLQNSYNAAFLVNPQGQFKDVYRKNILIPFGEGLPFGPFNDYLKPLITNISYFAKGDRYTLFELPKSRFISLICYEVLFTEYVSDYLKNIPKRPQFIVNLTNDSWYGNTAELTQHLMLTRWRAIEFNLPLIRATNTGITTIIDRNGNYQNSLGYGKKDILEGELSLEDHPEDTFFERWSHYPLLIASGFLALL